MPLFAIHCRGAEGMAGCRQGLRDKHLAHVEQNLGRYALAGPLRDSSGTIIGSLLVIEAESPVAAQAFLAADPYFQGGIWGRIEIDAFSAVAGTWVGGAAWKQP
jgi:uncharacterized protein YciI